MKWGLILASMWTRYWISAAWWKRSWAVASGQSASTQAGSLSNPAQSSGSIGKRRKGKGERKRKTARSYWLGVWTVIEMLVHENEHFIVEDCGSCFLPGYLLVRPKLAATSISDMSQEALMSLGSTLALATRAIEAVIQPERVYICLFCEQAHEVHFHIFPRTAWLASEYRRVYPYDSELHGPRLLDWSRHRFSSSNSVHGKDETLHKIKEWVDSTSS